jgi:hypothetical protein
VSGPLFIHPVWGFGDHRNPTVAEFFTWSDAADFAMHPERDGFEDQTLFVGSPRYDRRATGYRFEPLTDVQHLQPRDGRERVAA